MMGVSVRYKIAKIDTLTDSETNKVNVYQLRPADNGTTIPKYRPGQAIFLEILDEEGKVTERKPYSVASEPDSDYIELCIKMINGRLTGKLDKLKVGDVVGIEGPSGHFVYDGQGHAVFICGGTGITPFMSMLRYIDKNKIAAHVTVFYSVKSRNSILYANELEDIAGKNPNINIITTLTKETKSECPGWNGECGRIDKAMIERNRLKVGVPKFDEYYWWICGPGDMVKGIRTILLEMGIEPKKLKLEVWG